MSDATACPDSLRKTCSISAASRLRGDRLLSLPSAAVFIPQRAHLDWGPDDLGDLRRPRDGRVEVVGFDDVEAAQVLFRLHEGSVGRQHLAIRYADHGCGVRLMQPTAENPSARGFHLLLEVPDLRDDLSHRLFGHWFLVFAGDAGATVGGQHVAGHSDSPGSGRVLPALAHYLRTGQ